MDGMARTIGRPTTQWQDNIVEWTSLEISETMTNQSKCEEDNFAPIGYLNAMA